MCVFSLYKSSVMKKRRIARIDNVGYCKQLIPIKTPAKNGRYLLLFGSGFVIRQSAKSKRKEILVLYVICGIEKGTKVKCSGHL